MDRLKVLSLAATVAVAVSVMAAGPALGAKGGNSETAHACQQGGHEHRLDAATHRPFKNAGDCVNNGAKGEDSEYVYIDNTSYPCQSPMTGECWGTLDGNGLSAGEQWQVFFPADGPPPDPRTPAFRSGTAVSSENFAVFLNLPCGQGSTSAYAIAPADNISDTAPSPPGC